MTDVTVQETAVPAEQMQAWGQSSNLGTEDFRLSNILLMHGMSKMVKDRDNPAKEGDFRDNRTGDLLGSIDNPMSFVPFHLEKRWDVERLEDGKWKWDRTEYFDQSNSSRPVSRSKGKFTEVNGERYFIMFRAFILRTEDLERGAVKPYIVDFKNSSRESGRVLGQTMFQDNNLEKVSPAGYTFQLRAEEVTNGENTWLAYSIAKDRKSERDEEASAFKMYKLLKEMDVSEAEVEQTANHAPDDLEF